MHNVAALSSSVPAGEDEAALGFRRRALHPVLGPSARGAPQSDPLQEGNGNIKRVWIGVISFYPRASFIHE